jgi:uncharacterized membrane protein
MAPRPDAEALLDAAIECTFPASDPVAVQDSFRHAVQHSRSRAGTQLAAPGDSNPEEDMERIEKSFDIDCPVHTVYNQWTQFQEFPRFMEGVKEARQIDDTHLHWTVSIAGKDKEFDTEIVEQVPDQRIAWRSTAGAPNAGTVRFEPLNKGRTRVQLTMEYEPQTFFEKAADSLGIVSGKVDDAAERFKKLLERRGAETGAWRGEVHEGRETGAGGATRGSRSIGRS